MEDIIEEKNGNEPEQGLINENEEEQELESVMTTACKMGKEEVNIREAIHEVYKKFFKLETEEFPDDDQELEKLYPDLTDQIHKKLVSDGLGDWTVVAGIRFSTAALLARAERYASYKIARINVAVLEI